MRGREMSKQAAVTGNVALADPGLAPVASAACLPATDEPLLAFQGIWRHWGRGSKRWAVLRDVSLELRPGTAICVGGANGAGKTTLLRIASGILAPDGGSVTVEGITADKNWREYHRRIGFLSAGDRGLYARVTVRGHLEYWSALAFVKRRDRKQAIQASLEHFNLVDLADRRAERLSQGQRQRLRLALTLVHQPNVILLDEPRNSLDGEGLAILASAIDNALGRGAAVLWCAPIGEDQPVGFDRTFIIEDGELRPA
jgi:ABC-type multidrug transport system ATPase subunit